MKGAVRVMLNQRHWLDAYPDYRAQFATLVEAVNRSLGKTMVSTLTPLKEKTYKVGDLYDENGKKGIVYEVSADGKHGKIVSLEEGYERWGLDCKSKDVMIVRMVMLICRKHKKYHDGEKCFQRLSGVRTMVVVGTFQPLKS